jgi:hypothetical protein
VRARRGPFHLRARPLHGHVGGDDRPHVRPSRPGGRGGRWTQSRRRLRETFWPRVGHGRRGRGPRTASIPHGSSSGRWGSNPRPSAWEASAAGERPRTIGYGKCRNACSHAGSRYLKPEARRMLDRVAIGSMWRLSGVSPMLRGEVRDRPRAPGASRGAPRRHCE